MNRKIVFVLGFFVAVCLTQNEIHAQGKFQQDLPSITIRGRVHQLGFKSNLLRGITNPAESALIELSPKQLESLDDLADKSKVQVVAMIQKAEEEGWGIAKVMEEVTAIMLQQEYEAKKILLPIQKKQLEKSKKLGAIHHYGVAHLLVLGNIFANSKPLKGKEKQKFLKNAYQISQDLKLKIARLEKDAYKKLLKDIPEEVQKDVYDTLAIRNTKGDLRRLIMNLEKTTGNCCGNSKSSGPIKPKKLDKGSKSVLDND